MRVERIKVVASARGALELRFVTYPQLPVTLKLDSMTTAELMLICARSLQGLEPLPTNLASLPSR